MNFVRDNFIQALARHHMSQARNLIHKLGSRLMPLEKSNFIAVNVTPCIVLGSLFVLWCQHER